MKEDTSVKKRINIPLEEVYNKVNEVSLLRKKEIEANPQLKKAICELADQTGSAIFGVLDTTICNNTKDEKNKDMLLVMQLVYLKVCKQVLDNGGSIVEVDGTLEWEFSSKDEKSNVPLYM